jgi:hypothetical protein
LRLSLGLNACLVVTLAFLWAWPAPVLPIAVPERVPRLAAPPPVAESAAALPAVTPPAWPRWGDVASTNFLTYRDNLRAVGCPEKTVRDILRAEINDWFLRRRQPWVDALQPRFWELAAGGSDAFEEVEERLEVFRKERDALLSEVLGPDQLGAAAEALSRRESFAEQYGWLPAELQSRLVEWDERLWQAERALRDEVAAREDKSWTAADHARRKALRDEHDATRRKLLGDLADEFDLRNSSAAGWAMWLSGFEPTEAEWRAVTRIKTELGKARREADGGLDVGLMRRYGLLPKDWKAGNEHKQAALEAAEARYQASLQAAFSPERFAEYQRASGANYRETRAVTRRLGLPEELADQTWEIQRAAQAAAQQLRARPDLDAASRRAALREVRAEAVRSLRVTLGERAFAPYQEYAGGWLQVLVPGE